YRSACEAIGSSVRLMYGADALFLTLDQSVFSIRIRNTVRMFDVQTFVEPFLRQLVEQQSAFAVQAEPVGRHAASVVVVVVLVDVVVVVVLATVVVVGPPVVVVVVAGGLVVVVLDAMVVVVLVVVGRVVVERCHRGHVSVIRDRLLQIGGRGRRHGDRETRWRGGGVLPVVEGDVARSAPRGRNRARPRAIDVVRDPHLARGVVLAEPPDQQVAGQNRLPQGEGVRRGAAGGRGRDSLDEFGRLGGRGDRQGRRRG